MQEVVELPGLVADPEVVGLLADEVVEDHEVGDQDLVHAPPRVEAVQVVLGGLGLEVPGLVGQPAAGGVHALALGLQHARDRVLRQPVDLQVGVQRAQLARDRDVTARVARARSARTRTTPAAAATGRAPTARAGARRRDELAQQPVDLHRIARLRAVAGAVAASPARRRSAPPAPRPARAGGSGRRRRG